jgi:hypothetical protein
MKSFLSKLMVAGCVLAVVAVAFAADDNQGAKKKKKGGDPTGMKKKVDSAELPPDVKDKVLKILDEHAPKMKEAQDKVNAILTADQQKARRAAQKAATDAGKKGKEAQADVNAAIKLTDEQKAKMEEAQKAAAAARADLNKALSEVLNDEQKAKLGMKGGKKKKAA